MELQEQEREFSRRLLNILKSYGSYRLMCKKIKALRDDPTEYIKSGNLLVPDSDPSQEETALIDARDKLWVSLQEQSTNLSEPLEGILPESLPFDLTYTPSVIVEILDVVGEFVNAATVDSGNTTPSSVDLYDIDEDMI